MQILVFTKLLHGEVEKNLQDWLPDSGRQSVDVILQNGKVTLIKKTDSENAASHLRKANFLNCGIRRDKIELYRALKLDTKRDRTAPRRIIVNTPTVGGFKRSFHPFINKRYQYSDPPCVLFIPDAVFESLCSEKPAKKVRTDDSDPIASLLLEISREETAQKLREEYLGESPSARLTRAMIVRASKSKSPVLILGESGTGKDTIARKIFKYSQFYNKEFYVVNCSALQETLLESELFGHMKGSFTGAIGTKTGLFVEAKGGTIFLDEIGDLSLANQAKILHAVDQQEIRAIGSNRTEKVDVRIIAATNRNLASMINQNTFREDLYYRLNTFTLITSPLRENPGDIPIIASYFWSTINPSHPLSSGFLNYLQEYPWPGNVRELKTLLNSLVDVFGQISPTAEHVEMIRKYRKEGLEQAKNLTEDDFSRVLKIQCRNRVLEFQNILRAMKIELRPVINNQLPGKGRGAEIRKIQSALMRELEKVEDLCREPIFFKDLVLFDNIKRFRYILEKHIATWPKSLPLFGEIWNRELELLHDDINKEIFEMIWGKTDM